MSFPYGNLNEERGRVFISNNEERVKLNSSYPAKDQTLSVADNLALHSERASLHRART